MKRTIVSAVMLLAVASAVAAPVDTRKAMRVAVNFWNTYRPVDVRPVQGMQLLDIVELRHQYVFAVGETGFVVVSADDQVTPIVGYSFDSPASSELNPEVRYWLQGYDSQIAAWDGKGQGAHPQWKQLLDEPVPSTPLTISNVPALCATRWNQNDPYNNMCPWDSVDKSRAVVGCVATAMAQIMKYWNHPSCGTGMHEYEHSFMEYYGYNYGTLSADFAHTTYMWQDMPDKANFGTSEKGAKALATLSYHCGVAVDMMYGTMKKGGSGAYSSCGGWASECAESAFYKYFKYSDDLQYRQRNYYSWDDTGFVEVFAFSDSAWMKMIDDDLEAGRPIYYSGSDYSGGHAFVLDGSNLDGKYHFNWGWGGSYDGFFLLSNLAPQSGGIGGNETNTFNHDQGAIFGIEPLPEPFDTVYVTDSACAMTNDGYHFYEYEFEPYTVDTALRHLDTIFMLNLVSVLSNTAVFDGNNGNFNDQKSVEFCRFDGLDIPECEYTKSGKFFIGWALKKNGSAHLYMPGDTAMVSGNTTFYARWQDTSKADIVQVEENEVRLWPNPTSDAVSVELPTEGAYRVYVIDAVGRVRKSVIFEGTKSQIDLSELPAGLYFVRVNTAEQVYNRRIIKQ